MKTLRKILIRTGIVLGVLLIGLWVYVHFFLAGFLQKKLEQNLYDTFGTYYSLTYENIQTSVSFRGLSIEFTKPVFTTDTTNRFMILKHPIIFFEASSLTIIDIPIKEVLFDNKLSAQTIDLFQPNLIILNNKNKWHSDSDKTVSKPAIESFHFDDVRIHKGVARLAYLDRPDDSICSGEDIGIHIRSLEYKTQTAETDLRIGELYDNVNIAMSKVTYKPDELPYSFGMDSVRINTRKRDVICFGTRVNPKRRLVSMSEDARHRATFADILIPQLELIDYDLPRLFINNTLRVRKINLIDAEFGLVRNQDVALDSSRHVLLLHEYFLQLPFRLDIDTIHLENTTMNLDLHFFKDDKSARLDITNLSADLVNIHTNAEKMDTMRLTSTGTILKSGSFTFNAQFPLQHPEKHYYQCKLGSMMFRNWNPILGRFIGASLTEGYISGVYMNGYCTHLYNFGSMTFLYRNLKLDLHDTEGKKRNLLSFLGNIIVRDGNPKDESEPPVSVSYKFRRQPYQGSVLLYLGGPLIGMGNTMLGPRFGPAVSQRMFAD